MSLATWAVTFATTVSTEPLASEPSTGAMNGSM